jgi:hypothetical protein
MTRSGIAFLCLRFAAVGLWLQALMTFASLIPFVVSLGMFEDPKFQPMLSVYRTALLISPPVLIIAGIVLFIWAPVLARRMFPDAPSTSTENSSGLEGLALRLLGIYVWTLTLSLVPALASEAPRVDRDVNPAPFYSTLAIAIALAALGTWLFVSGPRIARWLLRASATASTGPSVRVQTIAFSIAGLVVLAKGLPEVVTIIVNNIYRILEGAAPADDGLGIGRFWPDGWVGVARVVLGLALFFGSHSLSAWWHRVRSPGIAASRREPEQNPG